MGLQREARAKRWTSGTRGSRVHQRTIALFIPSLETGGSERQLLEVARGLKATGLDVVIITIYDSGSFEQEVNCIPDVRLIKLGNTGAFTVATRLLKTIRREQMDIVYGFMSVAQCYSLIVKLVRPRTTLIFRIGDSISLSQCFRQENLKSVLLDILLRICRPLVRCYIFNSYAGRALKGTGLPDARCCVVHNGIDTDKFRPDRAGREAVRRELGVGRETCVIGCVGRFSIYKDHDTFIAAAGLIHARTSEVLFLMIGDERGALGVRARDLVKRLGLESCFVFLGARSDVEKLMPACDIGCSSSQTEGFPNVIGEFMACGMPCVVTDVGDSKYVVGDTGFAVEKSDPKALAEGLGRMMRLSAGERGLLGLKARERIINCFSTSRMVCETNKVLLKCLGS